MIQEVKEREKKEKKNCFPSLVAGDDDFDKPDS